MAEDNPKEIPDRANQVEEQLPPEITQEISRFFGMVQGRSFPPFLEKIGSEQIDKIIESADKSDERDFQDQKQQRLYTLLYIVLAVIVIVFLTVYLANSNSNTYEKIILAVISLVAGAFGGYGIGRTKA